MNIVLSGIMLKGNGCLDQALKSPKHQQLPALKKGEEQLKLTVNSAN